MTSTLPISALSLFEPPPDAAAVAACATAVRHRWQPGSALDALLDVSLTDDARCLMLRVDGSAATVQLQLADCAAIEASAAGGWFLPRHARPDRVFWLPRAPCVRELDEHARIRSDEPAAIAALSLDGHVASMTVELPPGKVLDCVIWDLPAALARELAQQNALENQGLFLWGSHTVYRKPADLYRHLVHGHVYEDRYEWPLRRKTCSENDAHALSVCLGGLGGATGKRVYALLQQQLLLAVLARQDADGGFRHGEWTNARESHYRLHASAMHLMMDTLSAAPDPAVHSALSRAMAYACRQRDRTALGDWFLHDELELSADGMNAGPFKWIASTACGKSPTNMLVLNTHLDTLVALLRYRELSGDRDYDALIDSARAAALGVLALRPMEGPYRLLFALLAPTFLPTRRAAALSLPRRALKRLAWRYLLPLLPRLKARYPRLVMPGGYVDRDLSLQTWSHRYLTVNSMDLARLARRLPQDAEFMNVLADSLRFAERSGLAEKWREREADQYSIGFLVEALYQMCTLDSADEWRALLAQQVLAAHDLELGLPPSVLGGNREIDTSSDTACPTPSDPRLRVVFIVGRDSREVLVVNPTSAPLAMAWEQAPPAALRWRGPANEPVEDSVPLPARHWRRGVLERRVEEQA